MTTLPQLLKAREADRELLVALLSSVHLPAADLPVSLDTFLLTKEEGKAVGSVGLELFGTDALLRSLAVAPARQGTGLGKALYGAALELAAQRSIRDLYLITTTAAPFFARLGFAQVNRSGVPAAIASTAQFSALCPASATVMHQSIQ